MVDFSINALVVRPVQRCFEKTAGYIASKHPGADRLEIEHDLKVLMFDTTSTMIVSTVILAYYRTIALVTAAALIAFFYFARRIIDTTIVPLKPKEDTRSLVEDLTTYTRNLVGGAKSPAPEKTLGEKIKSTFHQENDIIIGKVVLFKLPHHPLPQLIGMIFTRNS